MCILHLFFWNSYLIPLCCSEYCSIVLLRTYTVETCVVLISNPLCRNYQRRLILLHECIQYPRCAWIGFRYLPRAIFFVPLYIRLENWCHLNNTHFVGWLHKYVLVVDLMHWPNIVFKYLICLIYQGSLSTKEAFILVFWLWCVVALATWLDRFFHY